MKKAFISPLMGSVEIPSGFSMVRVGLTKPRDQVSKDATFKFFIPVKVGGIPVSRYDAVIRPHKGARTIWGATRKVDRPAKRKVKKGKR